MKLKTKNFLEKLQVLLEEYNAELFVNIEGDTEELIETFEITVENETISIPNCSGINNSDILTLYH